jgi:hypothetical protein
MTNDEQTAESAKGFVGNRRAERKQLEAELSKAIVEQQRIAEIILSEFGPKDWDNMNGMEVLKVATKATICARKIMGDWKNETKE